MADDLLQRARELYQKRHYRLPADWVTKLMADFARAENARLTAALKECKRYVEGHEEPDHECVQCLIEGIVDKALSPIAGEEKG